MSSIILWNTDTYENTMKNLRKNYEKTTAVLQWSTGLQTTGHYRSLRSLQALQVSWESHRVCWWGFASQNLRNAFSRASFKRIRWFIASFPFLSWSHKYIFRPWTRRVVDIELTFATSSLSFWNSWIKNWIVKLYFNTCHTS